MFGMFDWLVPSASSAKVRRSIGAPKGLLGFPSTPAYGGRKKATRSTGGLGFLGFPGTPSYQDASVAPKCPEDSDSGDENGGENVDDSTSCDVSDSSSSGPRSHGPR